MEYRAAVKFIDLKDDNRLYEAGEKYPRDGLSVSKTRIAELAGSDNRMGYPLIEAVESPIEPSDEMGEEISAQSEKTAEKPARGRKRG